MRRTTLEERTWWARPGLEVRAGRLRIAGRDAEALAQEHGTPRYVHDLVRTREQAEALREALASAGRRGVVRLALKAQRHPDVLAYLRSATPFVGLDVCSPGEIEWGRAHGFTPDELSYTGTNLTDGEMDAILAAGVHVNVDLLSQLDRLGRRAPGSTVGLRVNPRIGAGYEGGAETRYTGSRPTKFGVFEEQLDEALEIAGRHRLTIDTVHVHAADGFLNDQLPVVDQTMERVARMTARLRDAGSPIREVNTGGGLGVPQRHGDPPLDLDAWAEIIASRLRPFDVDVATEPGDFLTKESAIHLMRVVTVEDRDGQTFVGVDAGWTAMPERFVYGAALDLVLCRAADAEPAGEVTIAGNINEGDDLFARDVPFPEVRVGDVIAAINVGSYNASMWTEHCLRPPSSVTSFHDRILA